MTAAIWFMLGSVFGCVVGMILTLWAFDEIPEISDTHNDLFE
jgi:hypothetical protein